LVNPMQMAIICSAIANGGEPVMPYLVSSKTGILTKLGLTTGGGKGDRMFSSSTADILSDSMSYVTSYNGYSGFGGLDICCKTGTAEIGNDKNNAWFIGFSRDEDMPLAFAVVVEGVPYSETGSRSAMPIAKAALSSAVENLK
ncbi:MAG: penicillin-binding transpeptidase domain-containing protein, partial [Acutalibacteraceae bacterium]